METLAERLKFLRKKRGLKSKSIAAQAMGMNYGTYQGYEYGLFPSKANYKKIADFYGCSLLWLQDGEGGPFPDVDRSAQSPMGHVYNVRESEPLSIHKDAPPWPAGEGSPAAPPASAQPEIRIADALAMTARILESRTSYATALYLNIVHFDRAVSAENSIARLNATISALQQRLADMDQRIDALQKENKTLRSEINLLKLKYENPEVDDGNLADTPDSSIEKKAM